MLLPISLYLILYLQASVGDVVRKGKCPNIRNQPGFKIDKWMGTWIKNQNFIYGPEFTFKCTTEKLTLRPDGNVDRTTAGININTGKTVKIDSLLLAREGRLDSNLIKGGTPDGYVVPDTDYTNYAVAYSCKENGRGLLAEQAYILTRRPFPLSKKLQHRIYSDLARQGIDPANFITVDQSFCPSYEQIQAAPSCSVIPQRHGISIGPNIMHFISRQNIGKWLKL